MGKIIIVILLAGILYLLYINGYLITTSKKALSFIGSMRGKKATFSSCTGYIKRVVRFDADKTYTFTLDAALTQGKMSVELLDSAKREVLHMTSNDKTAVAAVEKKKKYYLVFRFKSATGKYFLDWN